MFPQGVQVKKWGEPFIFFFSPILKTPPKTPPGGAPKPPKKYGPHRAVFLVEIFFFFPPCFCLGHKNKAGGETLKGEKWPWNCPIKKWGFKFFFWEFFFINFRKKN